MSDEPRLFDHVIVAGQLSGQDTAAKDDRLAYADRIEGGVVLRMRFDQREQIGIVKAIAPRADGNAGRNLDLNPSVALQVGVATPEDPDPILDILVLGHEAADRDLHRKSASLTLGSRTRSLVLAPSSKQ
ncbi:MAG TPA: hypothetical protein VKZ79_15115 [Alphaproteobacteria bacterium]|nr:hypothetical protein [Alphaproteobacteria bacterium]